MTRQFKRLTYSIYECKYHIVFCPKYRYQILRDEVVEYTRQQIYQLCRHKDKVEVLELNIQPDHVHIWWCKYAIEVRLDSWDSFTPDVVEGQTG